MKKKVIVIRFGNSVPTPADFEAVRSITNGAMDAAGCGSPFGVISIFHTHLSPAEVSQIFTNAAAELGDCLPNIAFEDGGEVGYRFDPEFFEHFGPCSQAFDEKFGTARTQCTLSLDELLDLIKEKGIGNLTSVELKRLKELSGKF